MKVECVSGLCPVFLLLGEPQYADWLESTRLTQVMAPRKLKASSAESSATGVPVDYIEAVKWYRLAADQGDSSRQG